MRYCSAILIILSYAANAAERRVDPPGPHKIVECAARLAPPVGARELDWDEVAPLLRALNAQMIEFTHVPRPLPWWQFIKRFDRYLTSPLHLDGIADAELRRPHIEVVTIEVGPVESVSRRHHDRAFTAAAGRLAGLSESVDDRRSQIIVAHLARGGSAIRAYLAHLDAKRRELETRTVGEEEHRALEDARVYHQRSWRFWRNMTLAFNLAGLTTATFLLKDHFWLPLALIFSGGVPFYFAHEHWEKLRRFARTPLSERLALLDRLSPAKWGPYAWDVLNFEDRLLALPDDSVESFGYLGTNLSVPRYLTDKMAFGKGGPASDEEITIGRRAMQRILADDPSIDLNDFPEVLPLDISLFRHDGDDCLLVTLRYAPGIERLEPATSSVAVPDSDGREAWSPEGLVPTRLQNSQRETLR